MKVLHKSIALLFLTFFTANASLNPLDLGAVDREKESVDRENAYVADPRPAIDYTKISVYLHPVSLLVGANIKVLFLYSTIEIPMSLYNAPIIKPSVWNSPGLTRVGSDIGFRHYLAGRGEGLYLQPQVGAFYISAKNWTSGSIVDWDYDEEEARKKRGTWFDGMLYMGHAYKFAYISIYSDAGLGYGCVLGACTLIYDANIGLGISF